MKSPISKHNLEETKIAGRQVAGGAVSQASAGGASGASGFDGTSSALGASSSLSAEVQARLAAEKKSADAKRAREQAAAAAEAKRVADGAAAAKRAAEAEAAKKAAEKPKPVKPITFPVDKTVPAPKPTATGSLAPGAGAAGARGGR